MKMPDRQGCCDLFQVLMSRAGGPGMFFLIAVGSGGKGRQAPTVTDFSMLSRWGPRMKAAHLLVMATALAPFVAQAQTFDMSSAQFLDRFRAQLTKDNDPDTPQRCGRRGTKTACSFSDAGFQKTVAYLKKMNLLNGTFALKQSLVISETGGRVASVTLIGDRSDPANIFHFIGQVESLLMTLDSSLTSEQAGKESLALGLMRGDDDPTIGQPKTEILAGVAATCLSRQASETMDVGCLFEPRY